MLPRMCLELVVPQIDWNDMIVREARRLRRIIPLFVEDRLIQEYNG